MVFGFAAATVAGFLLTAIPNWTGRMPLQGGPLETLVLLWVVGRFGVVAAENRIRAGANAAMGYPHFGMLWGLIAVTGTIDTFRFSDAVAEARIWLLRRGAAPEHIDAGYVLNGWWRYAPSLPSGRGPEPDVPFVTTMTASPYNIANASDPAYEVVRRMTSPALWAASDSLYVLEHAAITQRWGLPSILPNERQPPPPENRENQ
jgi:hypothetical protein